MKVVTQQTPRTKIITMRKDYPLSKLSEWDRNPRLNDEAVVAVSRSVSAFGGISPIIADKHGRICAGHTRYKAALEIGLKTFPVILVDFDTEDSFKAYNIADNQTASIADWDDFGLSELVMDLAEADFDTELLAFDEDRLVELLNGPEPDGEPEDAGPDYQAPAITKTGDLWKLGDHWLLCGDATKEADVTELMAGNEAVLVQADPPYGMGKEKDGIANDNLYRGKLDTFQMAWWSALRPFVANNGSVYIWGNAEDLWRLWYVGGLKDSERLTFRNCIAWDKYIGNVKPTMIEMMRSYVVYREDCLFFMLGEQGFNNNADNYWEGWEPIRSYLEVEMNKCGGQKKWRLALGNQMGGHYFTRSQWSFPTEEAYKKLQNFAEGNAFKREYDDLKREYDDLKREFYATRAYFNNTHDNMTDVWSFPRVVGDERFDHATPKPLEMIIRIIKSSSPDGGIVVDPFVGTGTTLIACENFNRRCFAMEIDPHYCDVAVKRWEDTTGNKAVCYPAGEPRQRAV